ncbi:MAG: site-specific integrase [Clostridiales bacterium]|nr:site-specific integrase [Clostridiales bacterium]
MNELATIYPAQQMEPAREITAPLFMDFVRWIDRSETTTRAYTKNLKAFGRWMQETGTARPARQDIISYRDYLTGKGLKPNTVTAYLRSVKQFFAWTAANGIYPNIAENVHAPKVDHSDHKKDALTVQEARNVENSIATRAAAKTTAAGEADKDRAGRVQRSTEQGKRLYAMYLLAINAGLRTIELHRANVQDLETKGGQAWLYVWGKGRTEPDQKKPLAPEVAAAIRDYLDSRTDHPTGTSPLFVSTGNRSRGQRIATTTISTMLKKAMQEAGYNSPRLTAHSLRHTAGTACMELTGDIYQTQKYMRHANPATTEIYLHTDTEKQEAQTAQQLYNLYHGNQEDGSRTKIDSTLQRLTPAQLEQLAAIAEALAG